MKTQINLKDAFAGQKKNFTQRSSGLFPLLVSETSDLEIVIFNYWKIKNQIDQLTVNFRIFSSNGQLVKFHTATQLQNHNSFSMRRMLDDQSLEGMVEVEITALENLSFRFPGLIGLYRAGDRVSAVHSAGRTKNSEETFARATSEETNWSCKLGPDVEPFFHIFNGRLQRNHAVALRVYDAHANVVKETQFTPPGQPFASKIYRLSELIDTSALPKMFYLGLQVEAEDNFPRFVVGNYFKEDRFLEVTHSFPKSEITDYIVPPDDFKDDNYVLSSLATVCPPDLDLCLRLFPTNNPAKLQAKIFRSDRIGQPVSLTEQREVVTGGPNAELWEYRQNEPGMRLFELSGEKIPSRINASFIYRVKGNPSDNSTDFALGAHSFIYPKKFHHWGHGVDGGGFKTLVMVGNFIHKRDDNRPIKGKITFFRDGQPDEVQNFEVAAKSFVNIEAKPSQTTDKAEPLSWYVEGEASGLFCYWVAYNKNTGAICGEHAF